MYALELQVFVFAAGVFSHIAYFNHGEHHLQGTTYMKAHTVAFLSLTALAYRLGLDLVDAVKWTCLYDSIFLTGLFTSLLVYRTFLNPLNVFPGPWTARITSFDMPFRIRKSQMYKALQELHHEYGNFVLIGPGELSITHPHAVQDIFGADSKCTKSPWYDLSRPGDSLLLRRTDAGHAELRRIWSPAFSIKAVRGYEERIQPYRNKLLAGIDAHAGQTLDIDHWLALYAWDVMGDLTFGHSFNMLDTKELHWAIKLLNKGMSVIGVHLPIWIFRIVVAIPGAGKDFKLMVKWTQDEMVSRYNVSIRLALLLSSSKLNRIKQSEPKQPDIMSHLFEPYKNKKPWDDAAINLMGGESHLLINAGR